MEPKYSSVCIFMESGRTFTFRNAAIRCDNENALVLAYTAMSDGREKIVTFSKFRIVGFATCV